MRKGRPKAALRRHGAWWGSATSVPGPRPPRRARRDPGRSRNAIPASPADTPEKCLDLLTLLKERVGLLTETKANLTTALAGRTHKVEADNPKAVEADNEEDRAVGALVTFLQAHAKRTGPKAAKTAKVAAKILGAVFGSGTSFLNLRHEEEWGEVEARIEQLDANGYSKQIEQLGGGAFLDDLRTAHKAYGEVLGITTVRDEKVAAPKIGEARDNASEQLRRYVAAVVGYGSRSDQQEANGKVARKLLLPIYEIRGRNNQRGGGGGGAEPPEDGEGDGQGGSDEGDGSDE